MGKGKTIEGYVKAYVARRARKEDKTPREELAKKLVLEIRAMRRTPPAIKTLKKMISAARNQAANPQEQPWHLATLDKYPISPEALRMVLRAFLYESEKEDVYLSIREAKWVARLAGILKENEIDEVVGFAVRMAELELVAELSEAAGAPHDYATWDRPIFELSNAAGIKFRDRHALARHLRAEYEARSQPGVSEKEAEEWERKVGRGEHEVGGGIVLVGLGAGRELLQAESTKLAVELEAVRKRDEAKRSERLNKARDLAKSAKRLKKTKRSTEEAK